MHNVFIAVEGNVGNPSTFVPACFVEDTPLGETEEINELYLKRMWLGREFPDHDAFKKTFKRIAMYNHFHMKPFNSRHITVTVGFGGHSSGNKT